MIDRLIYATTRTGGKTILTLFFLLETTSREFNSLYSSYLKKVRQTLGNLLALFVASIQI
jgi:hypothetical protein